MAKIYALPTPNKPSQYSTRSASHTPVTYIIDTDDLIVDVNDRFLSFAAENVWDCTRQSLVGRSLWDNMHGEGDKFVYRNIVEMARKDKKPIHFPLRCDSPRLKRFMHMILIAEPDNSVKFISELDHEVEWRFGGAPVIESPTRHICRLCTQVEKDGKWWQLRHGLIHNVVQLGLDSFNLDQCPECTMSQIT